MSSSLLRNPSESKTSALESHASPSCATWRQLLPSHRLPVIAKTPLLVALGWYLAGGRHAETKLGETLLLSAGLWASLYVLNEATDLTHEQGMLLRKRTRALLLGLCVGFCFAAYGLSPPLGGLFFAMMLGQVLYCVPPLRLKRHWAANVILSGIVNPILRLQCGVLWGVHPLPMLLYAVCIAAHLGACLRARALLRQRDVRLGYIPGPAWCDPAGRIGTVSALFGGYAICAFGWVPHFFWLFPISATVFSLYAWSGRATSVANLRRNWIAFALFALCALAVLLR